MDVLSIIVRLETLFTQLETLSDRILSVEAAPIVSQPQAPGFTFRKHDKDKFVHLRISALRGTNCCHRRLCPHNAKIIDEPVAIDIARRLRSSDGCCVSSELNCDALIVAKCVKDKLPANWKLIIEHLIAQDVRVLYL